MPLFYQQKPGFMGRKGLRSTSRKGNKAVFHHLLAGTYGQFSAPFWQLWKISKRAEKQAKTKNKDDNARKIHGNQRISDKHNVGFHTGWGVNGDGKGRFTKGYAICKRGDKH